MEEIDNNWLFRQVEIALNTKKRVKIRLMGESMYPFLNSRSDILVIAPFISETVRVGDVVLAKVNDQYVLHRLIEKKEQGWCKLQGDANMKKQELVHVGNIIGRLVQIERNGTQTIDCLSKKWQWYGRCWIKLRFCRTYLLKIILWKRRAIKK
ncbi:S24/S26 family peptidase [uncultured Bacteroides sp.]|uniref:S24/S26 family peptidase n=1 Tax=uncultured Bacteroides sp. TaxID=162156 RepID=UPI002AA86BD3|nr:S24/S26 family peptidase [uncultured Bacteroides sp.]